MATRIYTPAYQELQQTMGLRARQQAMAERQSQWQMQMYQQMYQQQLEQQKQASGSLSNLINQ